MFASNPRLKNYVSMASLPTLATAGGMAVVADVQADIVYQDLSVTIGGIAPQPMSTIIDLGMGSVNVIAGVNAANTDQAFFAMSAATSKSASIGLINTNGSDSKKAAPYLARFASGDLISVGSDSMEFALADQGFGSKRLDAGSAKGNFTTLEGPQSGFVGFGYAQMGGTGYGWIALDWDGTFLTIDGYAYETDLNTGIEAGAVPGPGAVGLLGLAAGAAGMRRKRLA